MSWNRATLKEESSVITKGTTPTTLGHTFTDEGIPFLRAQNLLDGTISVDADPLFISQDTHSALKRSVIKGNDILISIAGTIGRASIVPKEAPEMNCNQAVAIVRPSERIDRRFMLRWLSSQDAISQMARSKVTGVISNLSLGQIGNLQIPLPPLDEQKRIAAILDQADKLRRKRQRAIDRLNQLGQAIFHDMFGDPRRNPRSLPVANLGDVANFYSGNSLPEGEPFSGQEDGHLLLKVSDLNHPQNKHDVICAASWSLVPGSRAGTCPANTLVFPKRGGAIGTNKKRWLRRSAILDPNLMGVHPHKNRLTMSFLKGWFQTFNLSDIASGSSVPQLNKQDLAPLKLALPPVEEQMEYARKIEDLSSLIRKMTRVDEYHNRLFFSLQQSAFEGEL